MKEWKLKLPRAVVRRQGERGVWWAAYSRRTVKDLRRAFREENVGIVLLENVEQIEECGEHSGLRVILLKLRYPRHPFDRLLVDTCLTEVGVGLIDPVQEKST